MSRYSRNITEPELKKVLLEHNHNKTWLYNRCECAWYKKFLQQCEEFKASSRGFIECPKKKLLSKNKWTHIDQCEKCEYCIEYTFDSVMCSGGNLTATKNDFEISKEEKKSLFLEKNNRKFNTPERFNKKTTRRYGYDEIKNRFTQQDSPIYDSTGRRWVQCKVCKKIKPSDKFQSYGGKSEVNLGMCSECHKNNKVE